MESFPSMKAKPPEGWTLGEVTITIERPEKKKIPVMAWRLGALAVHERISVGLKEAVITHGPTGLRIYSFPTKEIAAECAEMLEPLTDWAAISKVMKRGSRLFPKVKKIIGEIEDRLGHVGNAPDSSNRTPRD